VVVLHIPDFNGTNELLPLTNDELVARVKSHLSGSALTGSWYIVGIYVYVPPSINALRQQSA
jgi:hypothetical protein